MSFDFPIMPLAFVSFLFALIVDIAFAVAVSYGAAYVAGMFSKKPGGRAAKMSGYPIQYSRKGVCIPKVYGCERVSGNIIWMGEQGWYEKRTRQPHVKEKIRVGTYYRSFLIGIAEGSGHITKIWMGKRLLWSSDSGATGIIDTNEQPLTFGPATTTAPATDPPRGSVLMSKGDDTQDARFYTGEAFGKYGDLIWCYFQDFENLPGAGPAIPNFSFEICTHAAYRYTYLSENGAVYGVPLFGPLIQSLDAGGEAVDHGGGIVGLPMSSNPFVVGDVVRMTNTVNYDGSRTLEAGTTSSELRMTHAFAAETFTGDEIIVKVIIPLNAGAGRMDQDLSGNLYYGMNWLNNTYILKIEPDNTLHYDAVTFTTLPGTPGSYTCMGVKVSGDGRNLYVNNQYAAYKFDLSDGSEIWFNVAMGQYDLGIDADGNAYGHNQGTKNISKFASSDGTETALTLMGSGSSASGLDVHVDDNLGLVMHGGGQSVAVPGDASGLYNFAVRTFDNSAGDQIAIGGTYVSGPLELTYTVGVGFITSNGKNIFVLCITGTGPAIFKYAWDGATLTQVATVAAPAKADSIYFDLTGTLVLVNADGIVDDILWFYDADLNFLAKIDNMHPAMLDQWNRGGVGGTWQRGNAVFYPGIGAGTEDENPARIIDDLVRQDRYGAGISTEYINDDSILEELGYWAEQDDLISLALTEQMPMMDWVDFILSHCNGYRFWSEGKFNIGAFKDEASIASLTTDDLIREEGDNPPPPVNIVKRKMSETSNRIDLSWTDRDNTYELSVTMQQDEVDQRVSGKVRIFPVDLSGVHNPAMAQRMALIYLFESMYRFSVYAFKVGYKRMLLTVGDVIDVTDGYFLTSQKMRIISREEDKDGRIISIEATEDTSGLYPSVAYTTQQTLVVPDTLVSADDLVTGTLSFREHVTAPNLYISFAPGDEYTDGADLYRSYDGVNYEFVTRTVFDLDGTPNSAGTLTSSLTRAKAVMHRYSESFTVDIGTVNSLQTDITDEEFFTNQNLAKIGDEIIAWKTAEDLGSGVWRVTQLIRGMFGTEAIEHPVGASFATLNPIDFYYTYTEEVAGQTLYFKALATSGQYVGQGLADVVATEYVVVMEHKRPAPLSQQRIKNSGGICTVTSFPVTISFNMASKDAGYNLGGKGEGGWGNFTKDDRIVGINVTLKTITGTQIAFEYHDLDGYHADDYEIVITEADRLGNDPVLVELEPVTSLPSSKATANTIDLVP